MPKVNAAVLALGLLFVLSVPVVKAAHTEIEITPGPSVMSAEELALAPDPAAGSEHAEILALEIERNENYTVDSLYHFHLRAKIHSDRGRELADIEIPHRAGPDRITRWWGRTLHPDGSIHELKKDQLDLQLLSRVGDRTYRAAKAALPGVAAGCVIDYGYTLKLDAVVIAYHEIPLQRGHPIHLFRYRWNPSPLFSSAYLVRLGDKLDIDVQRGKNWVLIVARDIPRLVEEPMMPPPDALAATAILYYVEGDIDLKRFWDSKAKQIAGNERPPEDVVKAIGEAGLDATAPLDQRLRRAYEWTLARIENTSLSALEAVEARALEDPIEGKTLLARGRGSDQQIDRLFVDVARVAGAEAHLVLATDRRVRLWDPDLLSMEQFSEALVAVRVPSATNAEYSFLDPGSGLGYAEVPWWVTGSDALVTGKSGATAVFIPPAPAAQNVRETRVTVAFAEGGLPATASWTVAARGQVGRQELAYLRTLPPEDRRRQLGGVCGAQPGVEIRRVSAPGLDDPLAAAVLECEIELTDVVVDKPYAFYRFDSRGPWRQGLPDFPPGPRTHPVVFDYAFVELVTVEVRPPAGMHLGAPPEPVRIDSPYGRYEREVSVVDGAFRDVRRLAIVTPVVPPAEYEALRKFREQVELDDTVDLEFLGDPPSP